MEQELNNRAQELQTLLQHVGELDHRMHLSREYVDNLRKLKKHRDDESKKTDAGGASASSAQVPTPADILDEDMMGDEF